MPNLNSSASEDRSNFFAINQQTLSKLLTFVDFAAGLTIGFIEIDRERERDWIIDRLIHHPQCQDIQFLVLTYDDPDLRFLLDEILKSLPQDVSNNQNLLLIIKGLEYSIDHTEYPPVLQNLNFVRDAFIDAVPYPILFCLPSYQVTSFANYAPDFWAWKSGLFKFESVEPAQSLISIASLPVEYSPTYKTPEPQSRIDLLERLLSEHSASSKERDLSTVASILQQLGSTYRSRQEWEKAENYLTESLKIAEENPSLSIDKTTIWIELADVYREQRKYDLAAELCQQVLAVGRDFLSPKQWAEVNNILGFIYIYSPQGNIAENRENAIACFQAVLTICTYDDFPQAWAMTQQNLAAAYFDQIRGERAENIELAIAGYEAALTVLTPEAFPQDWAMIQNNLVNAYRQRIRGERAENIELAISVSEAALTVLTPAAFPQDWAMTQHNLAAAYSNRIRGERAENIERAISGFEAALTVLTPEAFPQDWAMTQHNLGIAYTQRIEGNEAENIKKAIECYQNALKIYIPEAFPREWEQTHNLLQAIS
jgi:tetratricopeptide (TPR) repeat protein